MGSSKYGDVVFEMGMEWLITGIIVYVVVDRFDLREVGK